MAKRAGRTEKISVSLREEDLVALRKRARKHSDGNLSATLADLIQVALQYEAKQELVAWLREKWPEPSEAEKAAIRAEWRGDAKPVRKKRRAA